MYSDSTGMFEYMNDQKKNFIKGFNFINFEKNWMKLDQDQQCLMLESVAKISPSLAVYPILAGLSSYHYLLRNKAREALNVVQTNMIKALKNRGNKQAYLTALQESDCFSSKIFNQIKTGIPLPELNFFFQALIKSRGKGPFYAWKICLSKFVSRQTFKTVVLSLSDFEKLLLTDQYLQSNTQTRIEWALEFKTMLCKIDNRIDIIDFLADFFDQNKNLDSLLFNIPKLRDINQILFDKLQSSDLQKREKTLKAVAMVQDHLDINFLIKYLSNNQEKSIRIIALKIIESSGGAVYSQSKLSDQMLNILKRSDSTEAFHAFKAIVITKKVPLNRLFEIIAKERKDILIKVLEEISSFSRISFFIIQTIAQNRKEYLKKYIFVFKAYILGITRTRPERVLSIIKKFYDDPDDLLRAQVVEFSEKINNFLKNEKKEIENEIKSLIKRVNQTERESQSFFKALFSSLTDKKKIELQNCKLPREFNFERELIEDTDFSLLELANCIVVFDACIIKSCNFSKSIFQNSIFQNSIIYNVDFTDVEFDSVCFDNTILIDIKASNARFSNCSFCKTSIYNSNFKSCDFKNSIFTGATIAKTSFDRSDLTQVSFVNAKLTFTTFIDSIFSLSDFTGAKVRYSKFDDFAENFIISTLTDFNARIFKINMDSIPDFDRKIMTRIEMLIFVEFLYYGEKLFLNKNKLSKLVAFDIYKKNQGDLFELIPLLLHENIPIPGQKQLIKKCPHGIFKYNPSNKLKKIAAKYLNIKQLKLKKNNNCYLEGLYTIGSTGSLAQTAQSDFDFWVVVNKKSFTPNKQKNLKLKFSQIEKWADKIFNTEVNFFLLDSNKVLNNDFGALSFESSGSAQARLLKEEFYRTIIYVAGKLPLWTVLPVSISKNYYYNISCFIAKTSLNSKYIDLGDIHAIPSGEYFGASIWHMYKLLKSPFKSVIKMALLEKFINEYGQQPLLCNKIKDVWMNCGSQLRVMDCDSYYNLIHDLIKYYEAINDRKSVKLIQVCFFLKIGISKESDIKNTLFGIREQFVNKLIGDWDMELAKVFEIGNYKNWEYITIERLSSTIASYMITKMRNMKVAFESIFQKDSLITPEERTVLVRNIVVEFSKEKEKIERVLLVSRNNSYFKRVAIQCREVKNRYIWELIIDSEKSKFVQKHALQSAGSIEEIGAWLINNSFYSEMSMINLVPNPTHVTHNDIEVLMKKMYGFFDPVIQKQKTFKSLLLKAEIVAVFVSINLCVPRDTMKIVEYSIIYMNSWNEMFVATEISNSGFDSMEDIAKNIYQKLKIKKFPAKTTFTAPRAFWGQVKALEEFFK